jgi:hypothetical protein
MKGILVTLHAFFSQRLRVVSTCGVHSWFDWRCWVVLLCYVFGTVCIGCDAFFGKHLFQWQQGLFPFLIAYLIVATAAWDWNVLGSVRMPNALLQTLLVLPAALLLGRSLAKPTHYVPDASLLQGIKDITWYGLKFIGIVDFMPKFLIEIVTSWRAALLFVILCVVFSLPGTKVRQACLVFTLFVLTTLTLAYSPPSLLFWCGTALVVMGVYLQYFDANRHLAEVAILSRLRHVNDEAERRATLRLLKTARERGSLSENSIQDIVGRVYGTCNDIEPTAIARTLVHRLVFEHRLLDPMVNSDGFCLVPSRDCDSAHHGLPHLAAVLRVPIILFIAVLWILMPLDLLPDALPVVGVIDDLIVGAFGVAACAPSLAHMLTDRHERRDLTRRYPA